jgi:ABC-2 type transport system permease protein
LVSGYVLALSAIAVVWGLLVNSTQAAEAFSFVVLFLPYLSDGFVPAQTMPALLRGFAEQQPITPLVATARALLLDQPLGNAGWTAAAWLTAAVALSLPTAALLFRRRTTS